jgi:hypothetical protein
MPLLDGPINWKRLPIGLVSPIEPDADVAVHRLQRQRLQDQHVQRALHQAARSLFDGHAPLL